MRRWLRAVPLVLLVASLASFVVQRPAETVPLYAARTGLLCQNCHFDPNGGGPRNDFGFLFARNRHELTPEPDSPWSTLAVSNRVDENMPLYFDVNQRFMLLGNNTNETEDLDRLGFFNMENAVMLAFMPHENLVLVYNFDAFGDETRVRGSMQNRDAFGMFTGLPLNGYVKAGRFRNPFGLRMDDHTVGTRNSFLDFTGSPLRPERFLPYDPRGVDMGIEIGAEHSGWYGRGAFTNGGSDVLSGGFAETKSIKFGYARPSYQSGFSFYDNYQQEPTTQYQRMTRWGYYGLTHYGPFAFVGEIAAGTDEGNPTVGASGPKTNRLAYFAEIDYALNRWVNFRLRYDHIELNRSSNEAVKNAGTHDRYALEGEIVPVPFGELRWTLRHIDHKTDQAVGAEMVDNETQSYLQFHFSY